MPDTYLAFAALIMTLACLSLMGRFMQVSRRKNYVLAIWYKGAASLCIVLLGLLGLLRTGDWAFGWKLALGLSWAFAATSCWPCALSGKRSTTFISA